MLVANLLLLLQFLAMGDVNLGLAVSHLAKRSWGLLAMLLLTVLLAAMATQAFSYEAISVLEGYWRRGVPLKWVRTWRIKRHVTRKARLLARQVALTKRLAKDAWPGMVRDGHVSPDVATAVVALVTNEGLEDLEPGVIAPALRIRWREFSDAWRLAELDALLAKIELYPATHRILPTRLGNRLRRYQDALGVASAPVDEFVLRNYHRVPGHLRVHHDQFRTRLDMYCTLTFVSGVLAAASQLLWLHQSRDEPWIATLGLGYLLLAVASYEASVTSAGGLGATLASINASIDPGGTSTSSPGGE
jgi:hypothetical protein